MDDLIARLRALEDDCGEQTWFYGPKFGEAADALEAMQWQPIETAPKDGTHVLLHEPNGFSGVAGLCHFGMWLYFPGLEPIYPTHWMPLPAPPTEKDDG